MTQVISALLAQVLACDAVVDPIIVDRVRRAVLMRDGYCRIPGVGQRFTTGRRRS